MHIDNQNDLATASDYLTAPFSLQQLRVWTGEEKNPGNVFLLNQLYFYKITTLSKK